LDLRPDEENAHERALREATTWEDENGKFEEERNLFSAEGLACLDAFDLETTDESVLRPIFRHREPYETNGEREQRWDLEDLCSEALARLTELQKRTILRYFYDGLTLEEIGAEEGVSYQAIQSRITRGLGGLRGIMRHPHSSVPQKAARTGTAYLKAAEVGTFVRRSDRWVRQLGNTVEEFRPTAVRGVAHWRADQAESMKAHVQSNRPGPKKVPKDADPLQFRTVAGRQEIRRNLAA